MNLAGSGPTDLRRALPRARIDVRAAAEAVTPLVDDVARRGYPAVREATLRFDGVDVAEPRVAEEALREAWKASTPSPGGAGGVHPPRAHRARGAAP